MEKILEIQKDGEWRTTNDYIELGVASKNVVRAALSELCKSGKTKSITRSDAVAKGIEVGGEGRANEFVYAQCEPKDDPLNDFIDPNSVPL